MFAVKMCCETSPMRCFYGDASVELRSSAPSGNIFENKSNIWRGVKFHSQCEPRCFVIPCHVNKAFDNYSKIVLNSGGFEQARRNTKRTSNAAFNGEMNRSGREAVGHVCWTLNICLGFVLRELQGILEKLHPSHLGWHGLAPRTQDWSPVDGVRTKTADLWSRGWKYWQSGHLWSPSHRVSGLWLLGLCKAHSVVRNLETLHNREIV